MKMLLHALGGCSSVDVVSILRKQKQNIKGVQVDVEGVRAQDYPKAYEHVHMIFTVQGKGLSKEKVISLFCSYFILFDIGSQLSFYFGDRRSNKLLTSRQRNIAGFMLH